VQDPYKVLGVKRDTSVPDLDQAYKRLKELYSEDSLATYSLLSSNQRRTRLESFDNAYKEIIAQITNRNRNVQSAPKVEVEVKQTSDNSPPPDFNQHPGAYLRWLRQRAGLSIKDVSAKTKITSSRLEAVELERVDSLPENVYLRGYVVEFAKFLNILDPKRFAEIYLGLISKKR